MNSKYVAAVLSAIAGGVAGSFITAALSKRYFESEFEARLTKELEATRRHYAVLKKQGEWDDPESLAEKLGLVDEEGDPEAEAEAYGSELTPYHTKSAPEGTVEITKNVFTDASGYEGWDQEEEEKTREHTVPYVISMDEYCENTPNHEQISLEWYEDDQTLCEFNNATEIIVDIEGVVGGKNLERFGHGSGSEDIVFVRSEFRGCDYEIVRNKGAYSEEVMGMKLEHGDDYGPRIRKFRDYDD